MRRIPALDMLRGYALVCIMLDHMPIGVLRNVTLTNFAVFDAAELFVLLSGFLVGLVWVKIEAREGRWAAQIRFLRRAAQVWLALIAGAIMLALFSALLFKLQMNHTAVWFQYARWIFEHPIGYVATVALMWMQPNLLDVLALYVLLIATVPVTVPFLLRWPFPAMAVSVAVWLFAEPLNALIPNQRPGPGLLFNPFGWQMLFFSGIAMGAFRDRIMPVLRRHSAILTTISVAILLFSLTIVISWKIGAPAKPITETLRQVTGKIDKWSLDFMRFIAILAASWVVAVPLARPFAWLAATRFGEVLAEIGRGGLYSFVVCVMLSIWGDALDMTVPPGPANIWLRLAIDLWLITAFWALAAVWMRRGKWLPRLRSQPGLR